MREPRLVGAGLIAVLLSLTRPAAGGIPSQRHAYQIRRQRRRDPEGSREGLAPLGQVEAGDDRVQVGTPAGQPVRRVWHDSTVPGHHPQQLGRRSAPAAAHAGADLRAQAGSSAGAGADAGAGAGAGTASRATSGRMSIRQPVRRAARRAFWPSLPMASDSW